MMFLTPDIAVRTQNRSRKKQIPAPVRGLIRNENLAMRKEGGAYVLENWFPTTTGIVTRKGTRKHATLTGSTAVRAIMPYLSGTNKLHAANDVGIYDITTVVDPDAALTAVAGTGTVTSGNFSYVSFANSGGEYLLAVNGSDYLKRFDGTYWVEVSNQAVTALPYDAQTGNFTSGLTVTGGTSGATGVIFRDIDGGATGTLWLRPVTGTFQDNETITDTSTGSATTNIPTGTTTVTAAITGVLSNTWSHIWSHKSRIFAVETNSQNFVYLDVDAIAGTASRFRLGGVFQMGGRLLTGGTWSVDAGAGMDDLCVFISTEGEVAVYSGTDPSDPIDWTLQSVLRIGRPLGKKALFKAGGDLLIATNDGLIALSASMQSDRTVIKSKAISFPIEELWTDYATNRIVADWQCEMFPIQQKLYVVVPSSSAQTRDILVSNARTGAWTTYTGFDARAISSYANQVFYGTSASVIYEMETGASDDGTAIVCRAAGSFDDLGFETQQKIVKMMRPTIQTYIQNPPLTFSVSTDFQLSWPSAPAQISTPSNALWGTAVWGSFIWGGSGRTTRYRSTDWYDVDGVGYSIAWQIQVTLSGDVAPDIELGKIDVVYEVGETVA